jgi:hypothetical protein
MLCPHEKLEYSAVSSRSNTHFRDLARGACPRRERKIADVRPWADYITDALDKSLDESLSIGGQFV